MSSGQVLRYLVIWSTIGFVAFSVYVVVVFRTGIVYTNRKTDGTLKERIPLIGYFNMIAFLVAIVGLQVLANYFGVARVGYRMGFLSLFLLNFGHYSILFIFDTVVIDGLVLAVWRPGFLRLPDDMGRESMKKHILISLPVGLVAGLGLAALSTAVSCFIFWSR